MEDVAPTMVISRAKVAHMMETAALKPDGAVMMAITVKITGE